MRTLVLALLVAAVSADLYMHNPPGSNDRNRERNDNRNNGNRLFDSQNNAKGGYPWRGDATVRARPDPITYYVGSKLRLEWTSQHACGPNQNTHCQLIIQYACDDDFPGLRDGYPDGANLVASDNNNQQYLRREFSGEAGQNQDGTNTIPDNRFADDPERRNDFYYAGGRGGIEFGMHEGIDYYNRCRNTERNRGLYAADQRINRNDASGTRQNPNGNRRGLECPEERDYYPYWRPVPWHDVAALVSDTRVCDFIGENSQNVRSYGYCECTGGCRANNQLIPITEAACTARGGTWTMVPPLGGDKPACVLHQFSRDNHLGNSMMVDEDGNPLTSDVNPETAHYIWEIPDRPNRLCVVRMRYNISTYDYAAFNFQAGMLNSAFNCPTTLPNSILAGEPTAADIQAANVQNRPHCQGILADGLLPLFERPYIKLFPDRPAISIAINTDQSGRTFQDRSYVFRVANRPNVVPGSATIWNLNVRGRRGNIVQAYPAVEYDWVPTRLTIDDGDFIHIQIHGSDFNEAKNANNGEGWQFSDRHNIVQMDGPGMNFPTRSFSLFNNNAAVAARWALLDQTNCGTYTRNTNNEQNAIDNCGKLNRAPARFPPLPQDGLIAPDAGTYHYVTTRNNNFSNRSHKAVISVNGGGLSAAEIAAIVVGTLAGAGLIVGGFLFYGKKNPGSCAGGVWSKAASCCGAKGAAAAPAPDMEYTRHGGH
jgi:hypothetical protein